MPSADQPIRCVGAVIRRNSGELLLILRAHEPAAGVWSLPGGRIEPGETDEQALVREVAEETGLAVSVGELLGTATFDSVAPDGTTPASYLVNDYRCSLAPLATQRVTTDLPTTDLPTTDLPTTDLPTAGDDALDARWVAIEDLPSYDLSPDLLDTLIAWGVV